MTVAGRYKNRKKTLRKALRAGRITPEEHARLREEAWQRHIADPESRTDTLTPEQRERLESWRAAGGGHDTCTNDECLAATGRRECRCRCEGAGHGAAWGLPPLPRFKSERRVCAAAGCDREFATVASHHRFCTPECARYRRGGRIPPPRGRHPPP